MMRMPAHVVDVLQAVAALPAEGGRRGGAVRFLLCGGGVCFERGLL